MGDYGLDWPDGPILDEPKESEPYYQEVYEQACNSLIFLEPPEKEEDARENMYDNAAILIDAYTQLGGVEDFYRFPAIAKMGDFNNLQQAIYICGEAAEAIDASLNKDRREYGIELMDIIHATETALRMEFSLEEVNELRDAVEKKNRDRGYYSFNFNDVKNEVKDGWDD